MLFTEAVFPPRAPKMPEMSGEGLLTIAGSSSPCLTGAVITAQSLALVTHVKEVAGLSQSAGTDVAAATSIQNQGGARRATGREPRAMARSWAELSRHLQKEREREKEQ